MNKKAKTFFRLGQGVEEKSCGCLYGKEKGTSERRAPQPKAQQKRSRRDEQEAQGGEGCEASRVLLLGEDGITLASAPSLATSQPIPIPSRTKPHTHILRNLELRFDLLRGWREFPHGVGVRLGPVWDGDEMGWGWAGKSRAKVTDVNQWRVRMRWRWFRFG
jgi:hypothetical protein